MMPTMYKACSGTSSCLPSTISLNPRTESPILTYLPSLPVNCAATNMGCERNRSILRARDTVSLSSSESSSMSPTRAPQRDGSSGDVHRVLPEIQCQKNLPAEAVQFHLFRELPFLCYPPAAYPWHPSRYELVF